MERVIDGDIIVDFTTGLFSQLTMITTNAFIKILIGVFMGGDLFK
jgi:hypothetical protein